MKLLIDQHHNALFKSFELLFEKRFGFEIFVPKGQEWYEQKFWRGAKDYNNHPGTIEQYLGYRHQKPDSNGVVMVDGQRGLTLEGFKNMDINIVIASVPQHIGSFDRLIKAYKPKAKLIFQMGNHFEGIDFGTVKNLMASVMPFDVPSNINAVFYHQEFDLNLYTPPKGRVNSYIRSFIHCLPTAPHFKTDWEMFNALKEGLKPDFTVQSCGAECPEGTVEEDGVAPLMQDSRFCINFKTGGDGFSHTIFKSAHCGTPLIVRQHQYKGKLGGQLMVDGKTCIDVDNETIEETIKRIKYFSEPERYDKMRENMYKRVKEVCNFDEEEKSIRKFIGRLK